MQRSGFTLMEILIVVIILGILAAIVIPQFALASNDARRNSMASDLQTVRSQLELYRVQHVAYPGNNMATVLTSRTNQTGATGGDANLFPLGPYLQKFPTNPFAGNSDVKIGDPPGAGPEGWDYNTDTGAFFPNDADHCGM